MKTVYERFSQQGFEIIGISHGAKQIMAIVVGGIAGLLALIGATLLAHRRLFDARVRATSTFGDNAVILLLWLQLALGLLTIPLSTKVQERKLESVQNQAAAEALRIALHTRKAWFAAVAAQESAKYAEQVEEAAEAGSQPAALIESIEKARLEQSLEIASTTLSTRSCVRLHNR